MSVLPRLPRSMHRAPVLRRVLGATFFRRWAHLILGGALLMPFVAVTGVAVELLARRTTEELPVLLASTLAAVPLVALVGLTSPVRELTAGPATTLLGGSLVAGEIGRGDGWQARWRTSLWFVLHLLVGGLISALTLALPPAAALGLAAPWLPDLRLPAAWGVAGEGSRWWLVPLALSSSVVLLAMVAAAGALLSRAAAVLLGPTPAERQAAARRELVRRAERHRLARELHDSVGHALSVVSVQAGAARHLAATDVEFAVTAMRAVEAAARAAQTDLDHVLGLLRDDDSEDRRATPLLSEVHAVVDAARAAGSEVELIVSGSLAEPDAEVSREAYRIVQECLTNCLRHAPGAPVRVRLDVRDGELLITVDNPLPATEARPGRGSGGGRGLRGVRERAVRLDGRVEAGPMDGRWSVTARLPWSRTGGR
ncbi:signal transduction histidine kinase [Actinoalloteichus hoggarensis]|uniref:histidine kinase n=1 Tax=Actinoalloteichus hoggarensis TaxID=1470176 RepID=A0A221W0P5_9PSEU|nr:histidine kinase [Actinoalloteichus hoggarensis]ASO19356.1 Sensor histidine kinase DesK [Actinoalloteichus hoggarensis]MBB5920594.1 signal transduction histidine kinase [Actinoalloteichus hoggarensis]